MSFFKILHRSKKSKARLGKLQTGRGTIETPAFVPCATKGTLKGLLPELIGQTDTQAAFVNTYHLTVHPGVDIIAKAGGIHAYSKLSIPLMSDSGGFQVFSLAKSREADVRGDEKPLVLKISDDGVVFRSTYDGTKVEFTPEKSIEYQRQIGADIIMPFDECTYYPATENYARKSMNRTHVWLLRCIKAHTSRQFLYGIIQGGNYENLRRESAEFVTKQEVEGIAIGGVSVGETKREMRDQVGWCAPYLPADKPVHLLGVGQFDDLYDLVQAGIDTFDCAEPTRLARAGRLYQWRLVQPLLGNNGMSEKHPHRFDIAIDKKLYRDYLEPVDTLCTCYTCANFTKSYLHHLFVQRELLGYTLATVHNLALIQRFMQTLRDAINGNTL